MNPVLLQKQLRDNASDLEQFSKDLQNWGEEMKRKDKSLKHNASLKAKVPKLEKQPIVKSANPSSQIPSKTGSTDYAKWDKFDAEAECNKLEEDLEDDSLSDEIDEKARDGAMLEKEKGNKYVKNKQWEEAIKCYTKAIELYSYDPVFYANRALCHLKRNKYFEAEKDCTLSLKLDKTYVKALQRRAAANEGINNLEAAEYDLIQVLKFEPNNKESQAALNNIRKKLGKPSELEEQRPVSKFTASRNLNQPLIQPLISKPSTSSLKPESNNIPIITRVLEKAEITELKPNKNKSVQNKISSVWPKDENVVLVKSITKPPNKRSTKPLKTIEIVEINDSDTESKKPMVQEVINPVKGIVTEHKTMQQKMEEKMSQKILEETMKRVSFEDNVEIQKYNDIEMKKPTSAFAEQKHEIKKANDFETSKPSSVFKLKRDQMNTALDNAATELAWPKPNNDPSTFKTDDLKILERKLQQENNLKNVENKQTQIEILKSDTQQEEKNFLTIKCYFEFYIMWRDAKTSEEKFKILQQINPTEIPNLFSDSLDFDVFSSILDILSTQFVDNKAPVFDILKHFAEVKRFSAFTMFMDSVDKNRLEKLITHIRETESRSPEELHLLIRKYEL